MSNETTTPADGRNFTQVSVSPSGAPDITYHFTGDVVRAELAGAKLYAEYAGEDRIDVRLTDASGWILADIRLNPRPERTTTENLMDIGSALLWSHWRYVEAQRKESAPSRFRVKTLPFDAFQFRTSEMDGRLAADVVAGIVEYKDEHGEMIMLIKTRDGERLARRGDWICRDEQGLFAVPPDVFAATYEPVEGAP